MTLHARAAINYNVTHCEETPPHFFFFNLFSFSCHIKYIRLAFILTILIFNVFILRFILVAEKWLWKYYYQWHKKKLKKKLYEGTIYQMSRFWEKNIISSSLGMKWHTRITYWWIPMKHFSIDQDCKSKYISSLNFQFIFLFSGIKH